MKSKYPKLFSLMTHQSDVDTWLGFRMFEVNPQLADSYLQSRVDHDGDITPSVRVFKTSPESISVQIRTFGRVGSSGSSGKRRAVYSSFCGNRQNMLQLAEEIKRIALKLPEA